MGVSKGKVITVERRLKELGLADSYFFFTRPVIAMRVDKKTGVWTVYIGELDKRFLGNRIIPATTLKLTFEEGIGAIKVLRVGRAYGFGFEVKKERDGCEDKDSKI